LLITKQTTQKDNKVV